MLDGTLQYEDTPMSADVLQKLIQGGALTVDDLADLMNIQSHSAYPYLSEREMRYSHLRTLCRRSSDARIPGAFYGDLMAGTGWAAVYIEADLDLDGDGDVDTDDVLAAGIESLCALTAYLRKVQSGKDTGKQTLSDLKQRVLQGIVTSERAAAHIEAHKPKRRRCRRPLASGVV